MTFDLVLGKEELMVTVKCTVQSKQHIHQRKGVWTVKQEHRHMFRLIAKSTGGVMYSAYLPEFNQTAIFCYSDNAPHNPASFPTDRALGFFLDSAPMDDSAWSSTSSATGSYGFVIP